MRDSLVYDRGLIANGQGWRLWSGHLAHHGFGHLGWNLAVFVPIGIWLERTYAPAARWFLLLGPLLISAALWWFDPQLRYYAGLSGVTVGAVTLLAALQIRLSPSESRWWWATLLLLVALKIASEFVRPGQTVFAGLPKGIRNVPIAHLAGAVVAVVFFSTVACRRGRRNQRPDGIE